MFSLLILKRKTEDVLMFPFIVLGRLLALVKPCKEEYDTFLFFPFYHIGGAEKVHYEIAKVAGQKKAIIYFTKKSHNTLFLKNFEEASCTIKDISKWTDNKWLYFNNIIARGFLSAHINRQKIKTVVFNGQCNFAYKISPWIKRAVPQYELIHSFNSFSLIRIPYLPFITKTVMISHIRIDEHIAHYKKKGIPDAYASKIIYISNAIDLPAKTEEKKKENFTVLYSGRGGVEKRLGLIMKIAAQVHAANPSVLFEIMGDVSNVVNHQDFPYVKFYGNVSSAEQIAEIYNKAHLLILTSDTEGFPMVVIEAMAYGCAILATPVGDIPLHIKNGEHGYLFSSVTDTQKIIKEGADYILSLSSNHRQFDEISKTNRQYAAANFDIALFNKKYGALLEKTGNQ
jgi:glycosyltransferase involved in cell wall biosynthesis